MYIYLIFYMFLSIKKRNQSALKSRNKNSHSPREIDTILKARGRKVFLVEMSLRGGRSDSLSFAMIYIRSYPFSRG